MTQLVQVPPSDLDAEASVLAAVMLDPAALTEVDQFLRPEHFYADANRRIYECVIDLASTGKPSDAPTIIGWLRDRNRLDQIGGTPYLAQILDVPAATSRLTYTAMRVVDKWRLRRVIEEARAIIAEAYEASGDVGEFVQAAEARIFAVSQEVARTKTLKTSQEVMGECITEVTALRRNDAPSGISTGCKSLDKRIGYLRPGRVYVVAGRPGSGKTSLVTKIVRSMVRDENIERRGVYFASIEMPSKQIGDRLISQETMMDTRQVEMGILSKDQFRKYVDATADIARWPLMIEEKPGLTLSELRSSIRRAIRRLANSNDTDESKKKLGLVAVDYFQLMGTGDLGRTLDSNSQLERLSSGLLGIAKEFGVPLVLLSQLNRKCEERPDKRPMLSDLRGTGALEQDAHTIMFTYRDDMYRKPGEQKDRKAEVIVGKCRGGRVGTVRVGYLDYCTEFVDEPDDDPEDQFAQQFDDFADDNNRPYDS